MKSQKKDIQGCWVWSLATPLSPEELCGGLQLNFDNRAREFPPDRSYLLLELCYSMDSLKPQSQYLTIPDMIAVKWLTVASRYAAKYIVLTCNCRVKKKSTRQLFAMLKLYVHLAGLRPGLILDQRHIYTPPGNFISTPFGFRSTALECLPILVREVIERYSGLMGILILQAAFT